MNGSHYKLLWLFLLWNDIVLIGKHFDKIVQAVYRLVQVGQSLCQLVFNGVPFYKFYVICLLQVLLCKSVFHCNLSYQLSLIRWSFKPLSLTKQIYCVINLLIEWWSTFREIVGVAFVKAIKRNPVTAFMSFYQVQFDALAHVLLNRSV